jgi:P4 family phage/plasmid primase-like protien
MNTLTQEQIELITRIRASAWKDYLNESRWCAWFQGERKPDGDGFAKVPLASSSDPKTWCSFDELCVKLKPGQGIGFNFLGSDLHPLDLDHVRNPKTKMICPEAMVLLSRLQTFSEISISGRGLHVLFKGNVRGHQLTESCVQYWNPSKSARFFTVTGEVVGSAFDTIKDVGEEFNYCFATARHISAKCREELKQVDYEQWAMLPVERVVPGAEEPKRKVSVKTRKMHKDFDIYDFLKFYALKIDNETDNSLGHCIRLATCPIKGTPHVGQNSTSTNFICPTADGGLAFHCQSTGCVEYSVSDVIKKLADEKGTYPKQIYTQSFNNTDAGNAERLAEHHGENIRFVHDEGKFRIWNGAYWGQDSDGAIKRFAVTTMRRALKAAIEMPESPSKTNMIKFFAGSENHNRLENMIKEVRSVKSVATTRCAFDQYPMLLNVSNGTIDLTTQTFRPHAREDMLTQIAPVEFVQNADCPQFKGFLADIFQDKAGQERSELIAFLQRAVGYTLTADTSEQVCFVMVGAGKNGKGVLLQLLHNLLGPYGVTIPYDMLVSKQNDQGSGPRDGLAQLYGARFARASEGEEGKRLHESKLKMMTAPDGPLKGSFLYQEPFEFANTHKLWMATNYEPVIRGTDEGIWRRINRINFTFQIPEASRILNLAEKIWADESSGILNWALEGVRQWLIVGLKPTQSVIKATKAYRAEQNIFARFAEACLAFDTEGRETATNIFNTYKDWARFSREFAETQTKFGREFAKLEGVTKHETSKGVEYRGVRISPKAHQFREPHQPIFAGRATADGESVGV